MTEASLNKRLDVAFDQRDASPGEGTNVLCLVELLGLPALTVAMGTETTALFTAGTQERIHAFVRAKDEVYAISDARAVIILKGITSMGQLDLAAAKLFRHFEEPVDVVNQQIKVEICAAFVVPTSRKTPPTDLLTEAERALDRARARPQRYTVAKLNPSDVRQDDVWQVARDAERAFAEGELTLALTPRVHATYGSELGALARLCWPTSPATDVQTILLESERATDVSQYLVRAALAKCHTWDAAHAVAVDIGTALLGADLPGVIADALAFYDLSPDRLILSITEDQLTREAVGQLTRLRKLGTRIRLAGVGTGGCPLGVLGEFCPDELYLAPALHADATDSPGRATVIQTVADLADRLGATLGASDVRDQASAAFLQELGCMAFEGELFRSRAP